MSKTDYLIDPSQDVNPNTCKTCKHRMKVYYYGQTTMNCMLEHDPRTSCKRKKIKCKNPACPKYEKGEHIVVRHP